MLKDRAIAQQPGEKLNAGQHLLASGQAGMSSTTQHPNLLAWLIARCVLSRCGQRSGYGAYLGCQDPDVHHQEGR